MEKEKGEIAEKGFFLWRTTILFVLLQANKAKINTNII